jgi:hypothetical protein
MDELNAVLEDNQRLRRELERANARIVGLLAEAERLMDSAAEARGLVAVLQNAQENRHDAIVDALMMRDEYAAKTAEARAWARYWMAQCLEARKLAAELEGMVHFSIQLPELRPNLYESDDFSSLSFKWCIECGGDMATIRPGNIRCQRCGK